MSDLATGVLVVLVFLVAVGVASIVYPHIPERKDPFDPRNWF